MKMSWKPVAMLCILGLLLLPLAMGCTSAAVAPADPVDLEETDEEGED